MPAKPDPSKLEPKLPPEKPLIPQATGDGFPPDEDISTPPPGSDSSDEILREAD